MRLRRRDPQGQRGFTLVEMIITALISGMLMIVVARLYLGSFKGWIFNYSAIIAQQQARLMRDNLIKSARQAQASTIQVSRYNGNQPPRSMLTFTDANGRNWAFLQKDNKAYISKWFQSTTSNARLINSSTSFTAPLNAPTVTDKVQRLQFYYPDLKDLRHLNFSLDLEWVLLTDNKLKPIQIQIVGEIEVRDP